MIVRPEHSFLIQHNLADKKAGEIGREAMLRHYKRNQKLYLPEVSVDDPYLMKLIQEINRRFVFTSPNRGNKRADDSYPHIGGENHIIFILFHDRQAFPKPTELQVIKLKGLFLSSGWTDLKCMDYRDVDDDGWGPSDKQSWWITTKHPTPYYASDPRWLDSISPVIKLELAE